MFAISKVLVGGSCNHMVPDIIDIPALIFLSPAMFLGEYILVSVPFVHVFHARLSGKSRPKTDDVVFCWGLPDPSGISRPYSHGPLFRKTECNRLCE